MAAPISLRADFDADALRLEARRSRNAAQARRLLALASIYDGGSRSAAARVGGVTLQIVRDWGEARPEKRPVGVFQRRTGVAPGSASTPRVRRG